MDVGRPALPSDRYLVAEPLGQGGMATVWRAWHVERGMWCAIKVLASKYADDPGARARFLDEGRTLTRLHHRNVIEAWEAVDVAAPYIVMEVADAGSLHDWVRKHGAMTPKMAVEVAVQICKGVGAAHRIGVVHRDVKPHNVLINRKGTCKISDFGIARLGKTADQSTVPDATTHHEAMGTLGYMAPEQRSHPRHADARVDVYGIGATLYTLLTGKVVTNLFKAMEDDPETVAELPAALVPILARSTAYKPEARFEKVSELARALHAAWSLLPEEPKRPPPLTVDVKPEPPPPPGVEVKAAASLPPTNLIEESVAVPPTIDDLPDTSIRGPGPPTPTPGQVGPRRYPATTAPPAELRFRPTRELDEPPPPPAARTRPLVVLATLVGLLAMALAGPTIYVRLARNDALVAERDFTHTVLTELPIIDELGQLGADRAALEATALQIRDAGDPASRLAAADRYLAELEAVPTGASGVPERTATMVTSRIRGIRAARDAWVDAHARWRERSESLPGVIAVKLRTADAPPPLPAPR